MTKRKKVVLLTVGAVIIIGVLGMYLGGKRLSGQFEAKIREQAILYLQKRFDSEVEMSALHISIPALSPIKTFWNRGRGVLAQVDGEGVVLHHKGRRDIPPLFSLKSFRFEVDLGALLEPRRRVARVTLDGMQINVPPKGTEPRFGFSGDGETNGKRGKKDSGAVIIEEVLISNARLVLLPKDSTKPPLTFDIYSLRLESAAADVPMKYDAVMTNPKPAGRILSNGTFGPWATEEPGDTPLRGDYVFKDADLSVFKGIAGHLQSSGKFDGTLSAINAKGEAHVPDFSLTSAGNPVYLATTFEAGVDGTNGNTTLRPVDAVLGKTHFKVSGAIVRHEGDAQKTISLRAHVPKGRLEDFLLLAMKGAPMMQGEVSLTTKIDIPPLTTKVPEKLILDGQFKVSEGKFMRSTIQDKIDSLSRRAQGQPKNEEIDEVFAQMVGSFHLENQSINFRSLSFMVPGAAINLSGSYAMDQDDLDFHGNLRLDAKISQTVTGWKHWVAKPFDRLFTKDGVGTFLPIKISGPSTAPHFGLDRGGKGDKQRDSAELKPEK